MLCLVALCVATAVWARSPEPEPVTAVTLASGAGDTLAMDWGAVPEYRIVPGDLLALNFGPQEGSPNDLFRTQRVRPDGRISVFPIGDVIAAGRTPRELEGMLVQLLSAEQRNPRVTVEVNDIAGNQVHVIGRVKVPGSYQTGPFMTVLQAITHAGGFEDDASRNSVVVFHRNGAHTVQVARLRLDNAMKSGDLSADLPLSRFDIVYVPRSSIGNLNVFATQFFGNQQSILNFALSGWQLFNLEKVYPYRTVVSSSTSAPLTTPVVPPAGTPPEAP